MRASGGAGPGTRKPRVERERGGVNPRAGRARDAPATSSASRRAGDAPTAQELGPARVDGGASEPPREPARLHPSPPANQLRCRQPTPQRPSIAAPKTSRVVGPLARALARRPSSEPEPRSRARRKKNPARETRRVRAPRPRRGQNAAPRRRGCLPHTIRILSASSDTSNPMGLPNVPFQITKFHRRMGSRLDLDTFNSTLRRSRTTICRRPNLAETGGKTFEAARIRQIQPERTHSVVLRCVLFESPPRHTALAPARVSPP